jgi:hypothetical protein
MRLLVGILLGALLTVIGVYIVDLGADGTEQRHLVNWDVVGERVSELTSGLQAIWADFTREITGPT